ncbi:MAG TPA: UPF0175 family protein [Myxococcota bacterium]|nr:UPF0175 family protein [Myxococcota bacterium]HNH47921.1 UPF0175 family protein [Myxococcota bacterium]
MISVEVLVQVTIDIPDLVAASRSSAEWGHELSRIAVFEAFRRGDISSGRGAQILGLGHVDFLEEAGTHGVPTLNYDLTDFKQELQEIEEQG